MVDERLWVVTTQVYLEHLDKKELFKLLYLYYNIALEHVFVPATANLQKIAIVVCKLYKLNICSVFLKSGNGGIKSQK